MIRMGRSSKAETVSITDEHQEKPTNISSSYQFSEHQSSSSKPVSESESMARDIKEGRLSGFIGIGTTLTGETSFQKLFRIDGHLTGRITSESGTLIIGASGKVDADIAVATAVVNGTVNGDIAATERVQLGRTARVVGNIQAARLIIEDGAIIEGSCSMLKAKESFEKAEDRSNSAADNYSNFAVSEPDDTNGHLDSSDESAETAQAAVN